VAQAFMVDADGERFDVTAELAAAVGSAAISEKRFADCGRLWISPGPVGLNDLLAYGGAAVAEQLHAENERFARENGG
jgi:hypothetical protein